MVLTVSDCDYRIAPGRRREQSRICPESVRLRHGAATVPRQAAWLAVRLHESEPLGFHASGRR
jgi:hypothetical protein